MWKFTNKYVPNNNHKEKSINFPVTRFKVVLLYYLNPCIEIQFFKFSVPDFHSVKPGLTKHFFCWCDWDISWLVTKRNNQPYRRLSFFFSSIAFLISRCPQPVLGAVLEKKKGDILLKNILSKHIWF